MFKVKEGEDNLDSEFFSIDYDPVRKAPPIHNNPAGDGRAGGPIA
jgi:hypothetical protein